MTVAPAARNGGRPPRSPAPPPRRDRAPPTRREAATPPPPSPPPPPPLSRHTPPEQQQQQHALRRRRTALTLLAASTSPKALAAEGPTVQDLGAGVQAVDLIPGPPSAPVAGEDGLTVRVLLKGRLFAKQGWVFLDDANERDNEGLPQPHEFTLGRREVIRGLEIGVRGMREGGVRRVVIPPRASYQNKTSEPIPRVFSNRQRLYTTIFNPTRLANGEGDTLSTVIFDIELVKVKA